MEIAQNGISTPLNLLLFLMPPGGSGKRGRARTRPQTSRKRARVQALSRQPLDGLPGHGGQRFGGNQCGGDFGQRPEHEGALQHARVRQGQARGVKALLAVEEQIQIERARGVAPGALAAFGGFDGLEGVEQLQRGQAGGHAGGGVDEVGAAGVHGGAAVEAGGGKQPRLRQGGQGGEGAAQSEDFRGSTLMRKRGCIRTGTGIVRQALAGLYRRIRLGWRED